MNPSEFCKVPDSSQLPIASTSTIPNGTNINGEEIIKGEQIDIDMAEVEPVEPEVVEPEVVEVEIPKTKKELEQEKKDLELSELLEMMEEWKPIIPDEVTDYYLQRSGFETSDLRVKRLLALAAQRFVSSISADAFQYARARTAAGQSAKSLKEGSSAKAAKERARTVLTMEDLSAALKEYGVGADRAQYYL